MKTISLLILFLLVGYPVQKADATVCAVITKTGGRVSVLRKKKRQTQTRIAVAARERMKMDCSDILVTGVNAMAKVRFSDAFVSVGRDSRLEIAHHVETASGWGVARLVKLIYGHFRAKVKIKKKEQTRKQTQYKFGVSTPAAVVGVRGTDFYVSYTPNNKRTVQATLSGEVEIRSKLTKTTKKVAAGEEVEIQGIFKEKSTGQEDRQKPKSTAAEKSDEISEVKFIKRAISPETKEKIRHTSEIVRFDKEFTTAKAIELLGPSEDWKAPQRENELKKQIKSGSDTSIPNDLRDLENEF